MEIVGKIVTVKINDRDINGKIITDKFTTVKGKCTFIGYNDILKCNQITINRIPIFPFDMSNIIKIYEDKS
jgi:hypothetical protein